MAWKKYDETRRVYTGGSDYDPQEKWLTDALKEEGRARIAELTTNEDVAALKSIRLGGKSPFPKWDPSHPERYSRPIVVFDTETGHNDEIIALGAVKVAYNNFTKQFETVDTYERYYMPRETRTKSWREHYAVHQLSPAALKKLRKEQKRQGLSYSEHYTEKEQIAFRQFFEGSILSGHNIEKADIPWALGDQVVNTSVVDTLVALENMRGRGGNKLDQVFKDITGMSMEKAGLSHHDAMSDVYATAVVLNALINTRGDTGQALRYVLSHRGTHLAPVNEYDRLGPTQVTYGPYKGYMRDIGYYIDRRKLAMKPTDIGYDVMDPNNPGSLKEGYGLDMGNIDDAAGDIADQYIQSVTRRSANIDRAVDTSKITQQFISLANGIRQVQSQLTQSLNDFTGALKVNTQSSRPAAIRFLSNFVSDADVMHNQRWIDAATAIGLKTPNEYSALYAASREYAAVKGELGPSVRDLNREARIISSQFTFGDDLEKRLQIADKADKLYRQHRITKRQKEEVITSTYDNMEDALDAAVAKTDLWTSSLRALSQVPVFNPDRFFQAFEGGLAHTLSQAKGVVPSSLLRPTGRFADLMTQSNRYHYAPFKATDNVLNAVGPAATAIAFGINPLAGAVVGGVMGGAKIVTQVAGNIGEASIQRTFNRMSMGLDILGLQIDMLTLPFTMLAKATNGLLKGFLKFGGLLKNFTTGQLGAMGSLGTPLTNLTGVGFSEYQGLGIAEHMIGLGSGTLNSVIEDFARQKQLLYTTGSVDTNRLVAASMLGVFNDVYGSGSYTNMINTLSKRTMSASDMALLSRIDPHSAQVVQVMQDLGITDLARLRDPSFRGIYYNPINDDLRKRMRVANYEYSSVQESFGNSFKRLGLRVWEGGGKTIANALNVFVASLAEGSDWKASWDKLKRSVAQGFSNLFGGRDGDWMGSLKAKFKDIWTSITSSIIPFVEKFVDVWIDGITRIYDALKPHINTFLNLISGIKVTGDLIHGYKVQLPDFMNPNKKYHIGNSAKSYSRQELIDFVNSIPEDYVWKQHGLNIGGKRFTSKESALDFIVHGEGWTDYTDLLNSVDNIMQQGKTIAKGALHEIPGLTEAIGTAVAQTGVDLKNTIEIVFTDKNGVTRRAQADAAGNFRLDGIQGSVESLVNGGR